MKRIIQIKKICVLCKICVSCLLFIYLFIYLKIKIIFRVVIADIGNDFPDVLHILRKLPFFDLFPEQVTKHPSEIFVSREGKEASGIRQHPHETADQTHIGKGIHLFDHPVLLVQEPPAGAELYLPSDAPVVEVPDHGCKNLVVGRV